MSDHLGSPQSSSDEEDPDRTLVRPRVGQRGGIRRVSLSDHDRPGVAGLAGKDLHSVPAYAGNLLLVAAVPLLLLIYQFRSGTPQRDVVVLKGELAAAIGSFEERAKLAGVPSDTVTLARYVVCSALDEAAANTPWGTDAWAHDSLLVRFHQEAWGGEKFFLILDTVSKNPRANVDILELLYWCIALGFQGRFALAQGGKSQLESIKHDLFRKIRDIRGTDTSLSPVILPAVSGQGGIKGRVPLWVVAVLLGSALLMGFFSMEWSLNARSEPVRAQIAGVQIPVAAQLSLPSSQTRLAIAPPSQPAGGQKAPVVVRDFQSKSVVSLGDGAFKSASAELSPGVRTLVERIARDLERQPGQVLVTGHTDSLPIKSGQYASNWELSRARARAVQRLMSAYLSPERIRAEGRADSQPLAPNDTAENRSRNRRVEITLFPER